MINSTQTTESSVQPFGELLSSLDDNDKVVQSIREKGYFELAMNQISLDLLRSVPARPVDKNHPWVESLVDCSINDLLGAHGYVNQLENVLTTAVENLMQKLCGLSIRVPLKTQEFCLRQPDRLAASSWHVDRSPKVISLLGTVRGSCTQYIEHPFGELAVDLHHVPSGIKDDSVLDAHLREFKPDHYYLFAAKGIQNHGEGSKVPLLVHRAPGDENRAVLLARWSPIPSSRR